MRRPGRLVLGISISTSGLVLSPANLALAQVDPNLSSILATHTLPLADQLRELGAPVTDQQKEGAACQPTAHDMWLILQANGTADRQRFPSESEFAKYYGDKAHKDEF